MESAAAEARPVQETALIEEIGPLADVSMDIEIVLDQKILTLSDVLDWQPGTVVTLNKAAGEPLDVIVAGELLGSGEIEVIYEAVGLRLSTLAS